MVQDSSYGEIEPYIFPDKESPIVVNWKDAPGQEEDLEHGAAGRERERDLVQEQLSQEDQGKNQPVAEGGQTRTRTFRWRSVGIIIVNIVNVTQLGLDCVVSRHDEAEDELDHEVGLSHSLAVLRNIHPRGGGSETEENSQRHEPVL